MAEESVSASLGASRHAAQRFAVPAPLLVRADAFSHDFSRIPVRSPAARGVGSKLTVSAPGDLHEQEANRIAEHVTQTPPELHRKCAGCVSAPSPCGGCAAEEDKNVLHAQGEAGAAPRITDEAAAYTGSLRGRGVPLQPSVRAYFEPRLGRSFGDVRVHTDSRAAAAAQAVKARAYTLGTDIVFAAGEFAPQQAEGRRLLAHELVHVTQGNPAAGRRLFRDAAPESAPMMSEEGGDTELDTLLAEITIRTRANMDLRQQLDALPPASSAERDAISSTLDMGRKTLMTLLEQRIASLKTHIVDLWLELSGEGLASTAQKPENQPLGYKLNRYEQELQQHENQLNQLTRWQARRRMASIDTELAEIDSQLAQLPPVSDPNAPASDLLMTQRAELVQERNALATPLTSTAHEYKQFDKRWGATRYGASEKCSDIKTGGCGPASLAMLLNYLYAEDPEALKPGPIEFVTPVETAAYAATHGRVCTGEGGTNGDRMVTQVSTQWPGFRGKSIQLAQAASEVRNGNLVLFLCHKCTGKTRSRTDRYYKGHFMVLSGVDDSGETFNVLDSGSNEARDIETITTKELSKHGAGYWIVEKK